MKRQNAALMAAISILFLPTAANAVTYQISVPGSTYEYLVPPEGPGVSGCQPDDFHCEFAIAGTLDFEIDLMAGNGTFVGADLNLTGNESTSAGPGFPATRASALEYFLINLGPIPLEESSGSNFLFREPIPPPPTYRFNSLEVRISGTEFALTGAYDLTPADGEEHAFGVMATAVPEPCLPALMGSIVAAVSCAAGRRRQVRRVTSGDEPRRE